MEFSRPHNSFVAIPILVHSPLCPSSAQGAAVPALSKALAAVDYTVLS
jgi:hypothetical protein